MDTYTGSLNVQEEIPPVPPEPKPSWWELHGTEVAAGVLLLGLGIGIPAFFLKKKKIK